jgi:hypothetical protein
MFVYSRTSNFSAICQCRHYQWQGCRFRPMVKLLWLLAVMVLLRATPAATQDLSLYGLNRKSHSGIWTHGATLTILTPPLYYHCPMWTSLLIMKTNIVFFSSKDANNITLALTNSQGRDTPFLHFDSAVHSVSKTSNVYCVVLPPDSWQIARAAINK